VARARRWDWARRWDFWLAVALAALLRARLDTEMFLADQAGYLTLARESLLRHALPLTSLPYSTDLVSAPLHVYLMLPFALLGTNPLPVAAGVVVCNVVAVALCYVLALRYFGRLVAAVAALLYAVCPAAIFFSTFIWGPNYLPAFVALWALTLYAGVVAGRPRWLVPHGLLLGLAVMLHPTAALLAPVTLAGVFLAPQHPRLKDLGWLGAGLFVLCLPTLFWESLAGFADIRIVQSSPAVLDRGVFSMLARMVGAGPAAGFTIDNFYPTFLPSAPYTALTGFYAVMEWTLVLLCLAGYLWLTARIVRPAIALLRTSDGDAMAKEVRAHCSDQSAYSAHFDLHGVHAPTLMGVADLLCSSVRAGGLRGRKACRRGFNRPPGFPPLARMTRHGISAARTVWRGLRADAAWRAYLLLWLWVTLPPLAMLRHSSSVQPQYLLLLYPALFLVSALFVHALLRWCAPLAQTLTLWLGGRNERPAAPLERAARAAMVALLMLLIVGQTLQWLLYTNALAAGQYVQYPGYGYTLGELQAAAGMLARVERRQGASAVYVSTPFPRYQDALAYLFVRERPDRVGFSGACLMLPPPDARPALVVATYSAAPASHLLRWLPGVTSSVAHVADVPLGGESFAVYRVAGALPALADETPVTPAEFRDAAGHALRLEAAARDGGGLRLRWTMLDAPAAGQPPTAYTFQAFQTQAGGSAGAAAVTTSVATQPLIQGNCAPTRWQPGATLFTWLDLLAGQAESASLALAVQGATSDLWTRRLGPVRVLAARRTGPPPTWLVPSWSAAVSGRPGVVSGGRYTLVLTALRQP
jgi:4-amino-4-deoxy-L-arabinose transferase-like glycosyltransferase